MNYWVKMFLNMIHPDYRDAVRKNIKKDLDGKTSPPIELRMLRVDGTSVIVEGPGSKNNYQWQTCDPGCDAGYNRAQTV